MLGLAVAMPTTLRRTAVRVVEESIVAEFVYPVLSDLEPGKRQYKDGYQSRSMFSLVVCKIRN